MLKGRFAANWPEGEADDPIRKVMSLSSHPSPCPSTCLTTDVSTGSPMPGKNTKASGDRLSHFLFSSFALCQRHTTHWDKCPVKVPRAVEWVDDLGVKGICLWLKWNHHRIEPRLHHIPFPFLTSDRSWQLWLKFCYCVRFKRCPIPEEGAAKEKSGKQILLLGRPLKNR